VYKLKVKLTKLEFEALRVSIFNLIVILILIVILKVHRVGSSQVKLNLTWCETQQVEIIIIKSQKTNIKNEII